MTTLNNQAIRQAARRARREVTPKQKKCFAQQLLIRCLQNKILKGAKKVAVYTPNDGEIDTSSLIKYLEAKKVIVHLPVLIGERLGFAKAEPNMQKNRFGIPEPKTRGVSVNQLNLIFMPLVAFDIHLNRLGMGGGFYDKTLAFRRRRRYFTIPKLIGLAYECQRSEEITPMPWDIPLDGILTPTKFYTQQSAPLPSGTKTS